MVIASRYQTTKRRPAGTNFILHSMRVTNSAVVAAWRFRPLPSGVAEELTGEGMNGTFTNVTFPFDAHGPSGLHVPYFDGSAGLVDIYSSDLNTNIDMTQISVSIWAKVDDIAQFTDSTKRYILQLKTDGNNLLEISKSTSNDTLDYDFTANSTADTVAASTLTDNESPVTWMHLGLTVDDANNELKAYFNGVQTGSTQTGIGTWSGALSSTDCIVGCDSTTPGATMWLGGISDLIIYSEILPASEMLALANVP